jgi:hypothetical protein
MIGIACGRPGSTVHYEIVVEPNQYCTRDDGPELSQICSI